MTATHPPVTAPGVIAAADTPTERLLTASLAVASVLYLAADATYAA